MSRHGYGARGGKVYRLEREHLVKAILNAKKNGLYLDAGSDLGEAEEAADLILEAEPLKSRWTWAESRNGIEVSADDDDDEGWEH